MGNLEKLWMLHTWKSRLDDALSNPILWKVSLSTVGIG